MPILSHCTCTHACGAINSQGCNGGKQPKQGRESSLAGTRLTVKSAPLLDMPNYALLLDPMPS